MTAAVPVVEIPYHADALGIRRPDCKTNTGNSIDFMLVRPHKAIGMTMPALAEKVKIEIRQLWRIGIGIVSDMFVMLPIPPDQPIMLRQAIRLAPPFEKITSRQALQGDVALGDKYLGGMWIESPHHDLLAIRVPPENTKRFMMSCFANARQFGNKLCLVHAILQVAVGIRSRSA